MGTDDDCINSSYGFDTCSNGGCTVAYPSPMPDSYDPGVPLGHIGIMEKYLEDVRPTSIVDTSIDHPYIHPYIHDPCTWAPMKCASKLYWPGCEGSDFDD